MEILEDEWQYPDHLVWVSMVQHYAYCPRQWALIEREQVFGENLFTLRGRAVHELVDVPASEVRNQIRIEQSLPIWSETWGLIGKADVVEFHPDGMIPVEYKHGPRKPREADDLQVVAQAVCLEEMFSRPVVRGYIYHFRSRHRREVHITENLKIRLSEVLRNIRAWRKRDDLPTAPADKRCWGCSLIESCLPEALGSDGMKRWQKQRENLFTIITETANGADS
jgi:CRISPR-associated exonuclease Cas4